ncbi:uncharacterized protein LOC100678353 isoform X1 [Nasonia vitripennis]|uniref:THAP-type domain-containing protein n=1 Tax=Nasonia vitripennis TaxID=7425 RepID=A0A7M7H8D0_NASVI|nr:uncharacterized protein LOC100678353 isoform X1 [Nasonia vitripennis]
MPSACAVPSCKTGKSNKLKQRLSIFKVPNNDDLRKKWENAIPDVSSLKTTQYVCERHFEEQYIIRRYIKQDNEGNVIADIPYKRPRLQVNTVPSLFKEHIKPLNINESNENKLEPIQNDCMTNTLPQLPPCNDDFGSIINGIEIPLQPSCENSQLFANLSMQDCNLFNSNASEKLLTSCSIDLDDEKRVVNDDVNLSKSNQCQNVDCSGKIECTDYELLTTAFTVKNENYGANADTLQIKDELNITRSITGELDSTLYTVNYETCNTVDILDLDHNYTVNMPKTLKYSNTVCIDGENIVLPQFWSISECYAKNGKKLVFTHTHIQTKDITVSTVLHKCVTIDFCDGQIEYFVYGRQINEVSHLKLPSIFSKSTILPILLKKFQAMHACEGIESSLSLIKESHEMDNTLCFGYNYHHRQCSLLSSTKICEHCNKLQKTILRRRLRSLHRAKKTNNVLTTLNIMDSQKLQLLKRKLYREKKRLKNMSN